MAKITRDLLLDDLRRARLLIERLEHATKRGALDPCDCGHSSIEHGQIRDPDSESCLERPCLVAGCDCIHFDDAGQQIAELRRKKRLAEAEAVKYSQRLERELGAEGRAA
jgi:hypothetical protein